MLILVFVFLHATWKIGLLLCILIPEAHGFATSVNDFIIPLCWFGGLRPEKRGFELPAHCTPLARQKAES